MLKSILLQQPAPADRTDWHPTNFTPPILKEEGIFTPQSPEVSPSQPSWPPLPIHYKNVTNPQSAGQLISEHCLYRHFIVPICPMKIEYTQQKKWVYWREKFTLPIFSFQYTEYNYSVYSILKKSLSVSENLFVQFIFSLCLIILLQACNFPRPGLVQFPSFHIVFSKPAFTVLYVEIWTFMAIAFSPYGRRTRFFISFRMTRPMINSKH